MEIAWTQRHLLVRGVHYHVLQTLPNIDRGHHPLLLLHGFTGRWEVWQSFVSEWGSIAPIVAIDFLGHGLSDVPQAAARYEMSETVLDLLAILDVLEIPRADVLGYSMGGRVALALACAAPNRLRCLILESASPGLDTAAERSARIESDSKLADEILQGGVEPFAVKWAALPLFFSQYKMPADVLAQQLNIRTSHSALGLSGSLRGLGTGRQPSLWGRLKSMTVPTLLITGQLDLKFCDIARTMAKALPCAQHIVIENSGHTVHLEAPSEFSLCVQDFLGWERDDL